MKFTKHLPFILKSVALATFFLAAFVFYDSIKLANNFKNYVVLETTSPDEKDFSEITSLFNELPVREEVKILKRYRNEEIVFQTENDSVSHYYISIPLKGKKEPTTIKRIRESEKGLFVNPFDLQKGHSYYFLYAENKKDKSEKIIFTHDGEVKKREQLFSFFSSFVKVYSDHQLILHLDLDERSRITVQKYDHPDRLNLAFRIK